MLNNSCRICVSLILIFFFNLSFAQLSNYNVIQIKVLYEALDFDKAIHAGQNFLKSDKRLNKEELTIIHQYLALSFYNIGKIDSARSHFLSLLSIKPDFELDPINISPKIISFFNQLKNEIQDLKTDNAIRYTKYIFLEDLRPSATFRSIVLPGWGQIYKHQKKRGYILGGAFIASLAATGVSTYFERDNHNKYLDSTPETIDKNYNTYNSWFKRRKIFTITTISIWAVGVLDALWSPYPRAALSIDNRNFIFSINFKLKK